MSWEMMRQETHSCDCGADTVTYTFEMDDWNRTRESLEIHCPNCREKEAQKRADNAAREQRRDDLLKQAQQLTTERYLQQWQTLFAGMTKKAAWERYTSGSGYPALGTFYQHVKHAGSLGNYMEWCLTNDLERSLRVLGVEDGEINSLLEEREQLWRPTSGPM